MSIAEARLRITEENEIPKSLNILGKEVNSVTNQMITNMRRVAQIGMASAQVFGLVIDQTFGLILETLLLSTEALLTTTAASLATPAGALLAVARGAAIISMISLVSKIQTGQTKARQQTQAQVSLFRMLTFR